MKVILAGYSKTGTKTMCEAFKVLGYNTYDMLENAYYLSDEWVKIITKGGTPEDFRRMYKGVDAVTDLPCYVFWEQFHEAFPDAKIILTIRDEDSWYPSMAKQWNQLNKSYLGWFVEAFSPSLWRIWYYRYHSYKLVSDVSSFPSNKKELFGETLIRKMYREHNSYVMQRAPKDKLLVYKVTEGWEPLCEFLGEEIPDKPFPHRNKGSVLLTELAQTNNIMKQLVAEALTTSSLLAVFSVFLGYRFYRGSFFQNILHPFLVSLIKK